MKALGSRDQPNGHLQPGHNGHPVYQASTTHHHRFSESHERLAVHTPIPGAGIDRGSMTSLNIHVELDSDDEDEQAEQDIEEVWFPGAHGDIGGGWDLPEGEEPLSHGPLIWMVSQLLLSSFILHSAWCIQFFCGGCISYVVPILMWSRSEKRERPVLFLIKPE